MRALDTLWYLRFAERVLRRLSAKTHETLAFTAGAVAYMTSPKPRRRVVRHHQRVASLRPLSILALEHRVIQAYKNYARYWVSLLVTPSLSKLEIASEARVTNLHYLEEVLERGMGALVVSPHIGNWDFGAGWFASRGGRVAAVTEELEDPDLKEWFWRDRRGMGIEPIYPGKATTASILGALKDNYVVALVSDRDITDTGVEVTLLGEKVQIPGGPAVLSLRSKTPILPCAIFMTSNLEHNIVFYRPIYPETIQGSNLKQKVEFLTQLVADAMGDMIHTAPEQWLAFVPLKGEEIP